MDAIDIKSPAERYKAIADAIREKNGITELMYPADMPQAILDIVGGSGGIAYTSITYNEDNTITLTDKDGTAHIMSCTYEDDKLIGVTHDGKRVNLTYDGDVLVKVGKTAVDLTNAQTSGIEPIDYTVKFIVDGEPYEAISVKSGNSVTPPKDASGYEKVIESPNGNFDYWRIDGNKVTFPYVPTSDVDIEALILTERAYLLWEKGQNIIHLGWKNNGEFAIAGWGYKGIHPNNGARTYEVLALAKTETSLDTGSDRYTRYTIEYEGETWHVWGLESYNRDVPTDHPTRQIPNCEGLSGSEVAKKMLDYYYMKINE